MYRNPNKLVAARLQKRDKLISAGVDPYPAAAYAPTHSVSEICRNGDALGRSTAHVKVAGRIVARREMGKLIFVDLNDDGAELQVMIRRRQVGEAAWRTISLLDLGDFIGIDGEMLFTRAGELSVNADTVTVLGKGSHPMPLPKRQGERSFDAVTDKGALYRQRHVDLLCNSATRKVLTNRSRIIAGMRRYLDEEGFLEVETPVLGYAYGGAAARPFVTRLNTLGEDVFLRISPECPLKRILCGGINKVYELGKSFRNEGIDASHSPEFTMLEWYEAYSDYIEQMVRFETLVARLCEEINGTTLITYRGRSLDLTPPWQRLPMLGALRDIAGVDLDSTTADDMPSVFRTHHPERELGLPEPLTWGAAVVELFEILVEPQLWDPTFVMDHPVEISPLTKRHRADRRLVERFEPMIAGMELGNAYSELNDPVEQYNRLVSQQVSRDNAYDLDEAFLQAVAHGMPPAGGTGLGVDRVVMLLTGAESIRDVVFFPLASQRQAILPDETPVPGPAGRTGATGLAGPKEE